MNKRYDFEEDFYLQRKVIQEEFHNIREEIFRICKINKIANFFNDGLNNLFKKEK